METDSALKTKLAKARRRLETLGEAFATAQRAVSKQSDVVNDLARRLRQYPRRLYWSNVTSQSWPLDIVHLITEYCNIAEMLYTKGRPLCRLMIKPKTLATLHVKHMMIAPDVGKYQRQIQHWLSVNSLAGASREAPRWKRFVSAPTLQAMATHFKTRRFTVGNMVLELLGPDGIIKVHVGHRVHVDNLAGLLYAGPLTLTASQLIVPYKPLRRGLVVVYGGRRGSRRLVKAISHWNTAW